MSRYQRKSIRNNQENLKAQNNNLGLGCIPFSAYFICFVQLKSFLKVCKVANYCKTIRQLLEKLQENCAFITSKRQRATFGVANQEAVVSLGSVARERSSADV